MKYFVQVGGKWKAVDKEEANKIMNVKVKRNETHKEDKTLRTVRSHAGQPDKSSESRSDHDA